MSCSWPLWRGCHPGNACPRAPGWLRLAVRSRGRAGATSWPPWRCWTRDDLPCAGGRCAAASWTSQHLISYLFRKGCCAGRCVRRRLRSALDGERRDWHPYFVYFVSFVPESVKLCASGQMRPGSWPPWRCWTRDDLPCARQAPVGCALQRPRGVVWGSNNSNLAMLDRLSVPFACPRNECFSVTVAKKRVLAHFLTGCCLTCLNHTQD